MILLSHVILDEIHMVYNRKSIYNLFRLKITLDKTP